MTNKYRIMYLSMYDGEVLQSMLDTPEDAIKNNGSSIQHTIYWVEEEETRWVPASLEDWTVPPVSFRVGDIVKSNKFNDFYEIRAIVDEVFVLKGANPKTIPFLVQSLNNFTKVSK